MAPFQYTPFQNTLAPTIAEILARQGDPYARAAEQTAAAQAQARQTSGNVWGRAIEQVGQLPQQIQQQLDARQTRQLRGQQIEANTQDLKDKTQERQRATQQRVVTTIGTLAKGADTPDEFLARVDDMAALGGLQKEVADHIRAGVLQAGAEGWNSRRKEYIDFAAQLAQNVKLGEGDTLINPVSGQTVASTPPKPVSVRPGNSLVNPQTGATVATVPPAEQPYTLGPGQVRFNSDGAEVAWGPDQRRTDTERALDAFAVSLGKKSAEDLDYADLRQYEKNKATVVSDQAFLQHMRERTYDVAHPTPPAAKSQDALEQEYRTVLTRGLSSRSGGLGLEDAKVQQANHLIALLDQSYDPKTDSYEIPKVMQTELALGLARLVSPNGQVGVQMVDEINQRTAKGDLNSALSYITGTPFNGSTQAVYKMFKDSIHRQGEVAQQNREGEMAYLRGLAPTELAEARRGALEATSLNPLRQSRVIQNTSTGERKLQFSTDGGKTWK